MLAKEGTWVSQGETHPVIKVGSKQIFLLLFFSFTSLNFIWTNVFMLSLASQNIFLSSCVRLFHALFFEVFNGSWARPGLG